MPNGNEINAEAPFSTQVSKNPNTGPITSNANPPATSTETSGTTNKSNISGTAACSFFSTKHIAHTERMTGMTCP